MFLKKNFFVLLTFVFGCQCNDSPLVKTPLGKIRGNFRTSYEGRKFSAFEGIPYAKPPIGERRFEEPEPIEPWRGVWDANFRISCIHDKLLVINTTEGDEDCLYLNVYVPRENLDPRETLDVIVHIHGGAYMIGSGHTYANPQFFMDKDVILVTFNYRLSMFGFLSTQDDLVPGNNGLKDQVMALKWIQKNIECFGGNPESVTLTGMSAGGGSVHFHYFSSMSKGLFHRGFSQSGVALNPWCTQREPLKKAKMLGAAVGCPTGCSRVLVECLKQRPHSHFLNKTHLFVGYSFNPFAYFGPVVEKGLNPFLTKNPYELLIKGKVHDLPWLTSVVAHEGMFPGAYLYKNLEEVDERWEDIARFLLDYNYTIPETIRESVAKKIKQFYLGEEKISSKTFLQLVKLLGDRLIAIDSEKAVKLQAKATKSPIYYYYFGYPGDHSPHNTTGHSEDTQYFFYNKRETITENEVKMKDIMVEMIVSFAKTGHPAITGVYWEPTGPQVLTYLNISSYNRDEIKLETTKELTPQKFWNSLGFRENERLFSIKDEL